MARISILNQAYSDSPYAALPDSDLVPLARSDREAAAELYVRYAPRMYRYLLTYAGSTEDAADLTQHVLLRCLEALPTYRAQHSFSAWLFRIGRNAAIDAYRQNRRVLPWEHVPESAHPAAREDPEAMAIERETLNQLRVLIARMSPERQELLALRFAAGLTIPQIAAVVEKSEAAVQRQLWRTIAALREHAHDLHI